MIMGSVKIPPLPLCLSKGSEMLSSYRCLRHCFFCRYQRHSWFSNLLLPLPFPFTCCHCCFHLCRDWFENDLFVRKICRKVPDFGGWSLDTDPDFGRDWHFCSTIINVRTLLETHIKGVPSTRSDKDAVLRVGFI